MIKKILAQFSNDWDLLIILTLYLIATQLL
ncbi:hypothetical protein SAMN05443144_109127 [Fodinibius roseus]|uniref:Uncharacterized protein n=1 Tax=Fodinibius roseus TaxID=1194090 RepID=A0A1M5C7L3_9BACT|nr:hypothetical protein SAMN05443144_109127 [Fodinibius roseus]